MLQSDSRSAGSPTQALREQFIGTWKLVSIESEESRLFGDRPVGILIYDADGNVAVQIMRNPRPSLAGGPAFPPAKEVQVAYKGYYAYYGSRGPSSITSKAACAPATWAKTSSAPTNLPASAWHSRP
jgi:hypothetical protein